LDQEAMTESTADSAHDDHAHGGHDDHGSHGGHEVDAIHAANPHLQHHFDTPQQQFDAGKLGIWLFLVTEILFFSGLFCAYTVYRAMHPEVFLYSSYYLDPVAGAVNTAVLILSSLTAAWAVRNAQLRQQRRMVVNIIITILCGTTFLVIHANEYHEKYESGMVWSSCETQPTMHKALHRCFKPKEQLWTQESFKEQHPEAAAFAAKLYAAENAQKGGNEKTSRLEPSSAAGHYRFAAATVNKSSTMKNSPGGATITPVAAAAKSDDAAGMSQQLLAEVAEVARQESTTNGTVDTQLGREIKPLVDAGVIGPRSVGGVSHPKDAHVFFALFFFMTGLHSIHVIAGIGIWVWMLVRVFKKQFGPTYFGPIDYAALYWHLVDMIWIYLFPLLYLIR
jgi:cytochrome c oxidase subunit III